MKRIISILLVIAMLFALSITTFAEDTSTILTFFDGSTPGATSGNITATTDSAISKSIQLISSGTGTVVSVSDGNGGYYVNNSHSYLRCNYRASVKKYMSATPVISFKYDMQIPNDGNKAATRIFSPTLSTGTATTMPDPTTVSVVYANNTFSIADDYVGFSSPVLGTASYAPGSWVTLEYRAYRGADGYVVVGVYVGDTQIFYAEGTVNYSTEFVLNRINFIQDAGVSTYMDNIMVSAMPETAKPQPIKETDVDTMFTYYDGSSATTPISGTYITDAATLKAGGGSVTVENGYIVNAAERLMCQNYKSNMKNTVPIGDILSIKFDMKIPEGSEAYTYSFAPTFTSSALAMNNKTTFNVVYANNKFSVTGTDGYFSTAVDLTADYTPGSWVSVELRMYRNTDGYLVCGVYVNDTQMFYGVSTLSYPTNFVLYEYRFVQDAGATSYIDNLSIYKSKADKPEVLEAPVIETVKKITAFDGSLLKDNAGTAFSEEELPIKPTTANISMYSLSTSTYVRQFLVKYSNCYGTGVSNAIEGDDTYYVMNWSEIQSNYRHNLSQYMDKDTPVFSVSYDIRVPAADSDKWRQAEFNFSGAPTTIPEGTSANITVKYDDGNFMVNSGNFKTISTRKTSYTPGEWVNVQLRGYLNENNNIVLGVYVGEKQLYYGVSNSAYTTNNLCLFSIVLKSETATVGEDTVTFDTHYDDIEISTVMDTFKPSEMLKLSLAEEGNDIIAKADVVADFNNICLVLAVYDNAGSMKKLWVDSTVENGVLNYTIPAEYKISGYKVKAFVFDALQSAIPQIESKELEI